MFPSIRFVTYVPGVYRRFHLTGPTAERSSEFVIAAEVASCCADVTRSECFGDKSISKVSIVMIGALRACERVRNHGCIEE
jgi:hypothetical protein